MSFTDSVQVALYMFLTARDNENASLFDQGDACLLAVQAAHKDAEQNGYEPPSDRAVLNYIVSEAGGNAGLNTLQRRLKVARVFSGPCPAHDYPGDYGWIADWELYAIAAYTDESHAWLARANDENMNTRELRAAIKISGGDPSGGQHRYAVRQQEAQIMSVNGSRVTLNTGLDLSALTDFNGDPIPLSPGQCVYVTLVIPN